MVSGIDISYKTVERLYSDELVMMALHNLHVLLLKKKRIRRHRLRPGREGLCA